MNWTGTETCDCYCGKPAAIMKQEDGYYLFCFAHSYESALFAKVPEEKPEDFPTEQTDRDEIKKLLDGGADKGHPTIQAWVGRRQYMFDLIKRGFREAHPAVVAYLELYKAKGASDPAVMLSWMGLHDYEAREYILNAEKAAPEGVTEVEDDDED